MGGSHVRLTTSKSQFSKRDSEERGARMNAPEIIHRLCAENRGCRRLLPSVVLEGGVDKRADAEAEGVERAASACKVNFCRVMSLEKGQSKVHIVD